MKRVFSSFLMCVSMFSVIPMPSKFYDARNRTLMLAFLPIVGIMVGFVWYLAALLVKTFCADSLIGAALVTAIPYMLTGYIHLDGYMDVSDAMLSRRSLEEKLRIMKDPHTGAFAVIAAILLFMFSFSAVAELMRRDFDLRALIILPVVTRACSVIAITSMKPLGHSQYSNNVSLAERTVALCVALAFVVVIAAHGAFAMGVSGLCAIYACVFYGIFLAVAYSQFKGVSGDITGYSLCMAETVSLCAAALIVHCFM